MDRKRTSHNKGKFTSNSYNAIHVWLLKNFNKDCCEHCGSKKFVEFALKRGKKHEHKRENYFDLCSSCHKKYDYTVERRKRLSKSLKGRKITWADKISKANKGCSISDKHKKAVSMAQKEYSKLRTRNEKGQYV